MNVNELQQLLRREFCVVDGPPRAFFEFNVPAGTPDDLFNVRIVYDTVGVAMRGEPDDVEDVLAGWMAQRMRAYFPKETREDATAVIFMRRWPQLAGYVNESGFECTKLTMRLAIPGHQLRTIFGDGLLQEGQLVFQL